MRVVLGRLTCSDAYSLSTEEANNVDTSFAHLFTVVLLSLILDSEEIDAEMLEIEAHASEDLKPQLALNSTH